MAQGCDWHSLTQPRNAVNGSRPSTTLPKYKYAVEDAFPDDGPLLNSWGAYLRARYCKRKELYEGLDTSDQELIRKEVRRIRHFREHFKDYRISKNELPLVALLDDSRTKWRNIAHRRSADELEKCRKQMEKKGGSDSLKRNLEILKHVQQWQTPSYIKILKEFSPNAYMPDLDAGSIGNEDDPRQKDYGYNGWIIVWEDGKGWVSMEHPLVHGSFPHQKISIQQFLYNKEGTPLRRRLGKDQLRYFHLPANNMKWVEEAMSRYYGEDNVEFDGKRVLTVKHNSQRLLRNDLWRGQQRGGSNLPAHARQIGSRCSVIPSAPLPDSTNRTHGKDVSVFVSWH